MTLATTLVTSRVAPTVGPGAATFFAMLLASCGPTPSEARWKAVQSLSVAPCKVTVRDRRVHATLVFAREGDVVRADIDDAVPSEQRIDSQAAQCIHDQLLAARRTPAEESEQTMGVTYVVDAGGALTVVDAPFDRGAAASALSERKRTAACSSLEAPKGSGHLMVFFSPNGTAEKVVVDQPPFAGTPTGDCLRDHFSSVRIPPFNGSPVKVGITFFIGGAYPPWSGTPPAL
jgi:hypothetical protein